MADLNKVILIGRLTRDPEIKTFANGGRVAKLGFAVTNRKKNAQSGEWEDDPMFIDIDVFNRGESKTIEQIEQRLTKGSQVCIEGKLYLEKWDDRTSGEKRNKHKIIADSVIFLEPRRDSMGSAPAGGDTEFGEPAAPPPARTNRPAPPRPAPPRPTGNGNTRSAPTFAADDDSNRGGDDDIPF